MLDDNIYEERSRRWLQPDRAEQTAPSSSAACQQETATNAVPGAAEEKQGARDGAVESMETDQEPASQYMVSGSNLDRDKGMLSEIHPNTKDCLEHLSQLLHLSDFPKVHHSCGTLLLMATCRAQATSSSEGRKARGHCI